jgi:hypothetical protein
MTQRIRTSARQPSLPSSPSPSLPAGRLEMALRLGYMGICLLAIAAAGVLASGQAATAALSLATVAVAAPPALPQDICTTNTTTAVATAIAPTGRACANPLARGGSASGAC